MPNRKAWALLNRSQPDYPHIIEPFSESIESNFTQMRSHLPSPVIQKLRSNELANRLRYSVLFACPPMGARARLPIPTNKGTYMSADVLAKVQAVVADKLEVEPSKITPAANFTDDLGADSLDVVELVMALEEEFDVEIPDEEAEKLQTVQAVVDYINAKQA